MANIVEILLKVLGAPAAKQEVKGVEDALTRLKEIGSRPAGSSPAGAVAAVGEAAATSIPLIADLVSGAVGFVAAGAAMAATATAAAAALSVRFAFELKAATNSLTIFLGSAEKATDRVRGFVNILAGSKRFTLDELETGSKRLQVFGGDALATQDVIKMVGDAAVFSGARFGQMSDLTARLYDGLQRGKPIAEVTQSLFELGIITREQKDRFDSRTRYQSHLTC